MVRALRRRAAVGAAALAGLLCALEVDGRAALDGRAVVAKELELCLGVLVEDSVGGEEVVLGFVAGLEGRLGGILGPET